LTLPPLINAIPSLSLLATVGPVSNSAEFLASDQVAEAKLGRIDSQPPRRHVDQPFHHKGRDRAPNAAIRPRWRFARCNRA
jgi:hypothetical protein